MIDKELKLRQQRESLQARINALIIEPADTPLGKPVDPVVTEWTGDLNSLVELADTSSPFLEAWRTVIRRSDQKVDLALKDRYPDFSIGLAYTQRDQLQNGMKGYDFISGMFNVSIPLYFNKKTR